MSKRIPALLLCGSLCLSMAACGSPSTPTTEATAAPTAAPTEVIGMANPMHTVGSYQELTLAQPANKLNDAPSGSVNVSYSWTEGSPVISQIDFTVNNADFCYRSACTAANSNVDISGVYQNFPSITTAKVSQLNTAGGTYTLRYDNTTGEGVATWRSNITGCQYSLYSKTGCTGDLSAFTNVMNNLYTCMQDAKTASGTVQGYQNGTLTVTLDTGKSCVLECRDMDVIQAEPGDIVTITYQGDLAGVAYALKITKTGETRTQQVTGYVLSISNAELTLRTSDGNVYGIDVTPKTAVTGVANEVEVDDEVTVTYTGDLYGDCTATEIEVLYFAPPTAPTTTSPSYTQKAIQGTVTSVSGYYVTVQGMTFEVNPSKCAVSGTAYVGYNAYICYNDYGSQRVVVTASFTAPTPTTPYVNRETYGTVTYANGIWVGVNGHDFTVNGANCRVSGTAQVGGMGHIYYRDYGNGNYEVTEAIFTASPTQPTATTGQRSQTFSGTVESLNGIWIVVNGVTFDRNGTHCSSSGNAEVGATAYINYHVDSNGNNIADSINYVAPTPTPTEDPGRYTTRTGRVTGMDGKYCYVDGVQYIINDYTGTPAVNALATLNCKEYNDGRVVVLSAHFDPMVIETAPAETTPAVIGGSGTVNPNAEGNVINSNGTPIEVG